MHQFASGAHTGYTRTAKAALLTFWLGALIIGLSFLSLLIWLDTTVFFTMHSIGYVLMVVAFLVICFAKDELSPGRGEQPENIQMMPIITRVGSRVVVTMPKVRTRAGRSRDTETV